MDISIKQTDSVKFEVSKGSSSILVGEPKELNIGLSKEEIIISPKKSAGPAFEFVQRVVAGSSVVRCTIDQFNSITLHDGKTWYAVTTTQDELRYLYLGSTLIAKANQDSGVWGFAYSFPITFGR